MSKSYNMTGWRLGFVAGTARAVQAFAEVKDNTDSGQFKAIQVAACAGIADVALSEAIRAHYQRRLEKLVAVLQAAGFDAAMPGRHVLPLRARTHGRGRPGLRHRRRRLAVPDSRALHLHRAVG